MHILTQHEIQFVGGGDAFFSFLAGALGLDTLSFGILMLIFECDLNDFMFYCMGVLLFNPALMGEGWYVNYG